MTFIRFKVRHGSLSIGNMDDLKQALNIFEFVKFCKPQSVEFLINLHTAYNIFSSLINEHNPKNSVIDS